MSRSLARRPAAFAEIADFADTLPVAAVRSTPREAPAPRPVARGLRVGPAADGVLLRLLLCAALAVVTLALAGSLV